MLTKQAADDEVGASSVPKDWDSIAQEAIYWLDNPWCSAQAGHNGHLCLDRRTFDPQNNVLRHAQSCKRLLICQQVGGDITAKHGKEELDMRVYCVCRAIRLPEFAVSKRNLYMVTAAWTVVSHRGRVQLKLIFVEEGDGQPGKTKYSLYKIHCRKQDMVKRLLLVCKSPEHVQVKAFSPIEMDKSSGLGCRPKTVKEDLEPLALACGLVSNVGRRSLRSVSATSLSSSPADAPGLDELLLLETLIEGGLRMLLRGFAAFRSCRLGL